MAKENKQEAKQTEFKQHEQVAIIILPESGAVKKETERIVPGTVANRLIKKGFAKLK